MTASPISAATSPSRRTLLTGAIGGLAALAAGAIAHADPVRANDPNDVVLGTSNSATTTTAITNNSNGAAVFAAYATDSATGIGLYANTIASIAVRGFSHSTLVAATSGYSNGNCSGVYGYSGTGIEPAAPANTGVYGYAAQGSSSRGVSGESPDGHAIHGESSGSGWAGYFDGRILTKRYVELVEMSSPSAPSDNNRARLFIRDNGSGKTQLCVRFTTGAIQVIATQP